MIKKISLKKIMVSALIIVFTLSLTPILSACAPPKLTFEDIVISSSIEKDTNKPADPKTEFEITAQHIYATIKYTGTKGGDNWRFKWTYLDTGEVVLDKGDQYNKEQKGRYFEGIIESDIYPLNEKTVIPPGNYKVEFYNNGELIKTATFKVNKPQVKIMEVSLANQVDQNYAPVNPTQKFNSNETVYACVKFDIQATGNTVKAQWKSSAGELLSEASTDLLVSSIPSYITFWYPPKTGDIPAGSYKVEIYLNDNLYGSFDFEVTEATGEVTVTFDQGNKYSSADFGFTIAIPDNWTYEESKAQGEIGLKINPPSQNLPISFLFKAVNPGGYSPYEKFADNDSASFAKQLNWTFIDKTKNDAVLKNGTPYKEYFYNYTDKDKNKWTMAYCFIENKGKLYLLITVVNESQLDLAQAVYSGILNSLTFQ
jgi:hypothetical protein